MNERIDELDPSASAQLTELLQSKPDGTDDLLLASIEFFCAHHHIPFSKERALRGLPLGGFSLGVKEYASACENVGLLSKAEAIAPSKVSELVYPFLVFFKDATVGIVIGRADAKRFNVTCWDEAGQTSEKTFTNRQLDQRTLKTVFYVTVAPSPKISEVSAPEREPHWFWSTVRKFWPNWLYVVLATFFVNLLGLALPLFVMNVYDRVIPNNSTATLWALVLGVSIAIGFDFLLKILRSAMIDNSGKRIDIGVSSKIFEHALDVKMDKRPLRSGELASHIRDFEAVREFFSSGAITSLIDLLFIGVFLSFLWFIVGPLALVPLLAVPVVLIVTCLVQFPLSRSIKNSQSASGNRHSVLVESLIGIETVKSVSAEGVLQRRWDEAVTAATRAGASTRFWSSLTVNFTMLTQQAVSVMVIAWGVFLVASGDITIGALIAANILAGRILAPLGGISGTLVRAQQSFASLGNLNALMKLERDNPKYRSSGVKTTSGRVEFRGVDFAYPGQLASALYDVSFKISPGERVGIIGRVGSGKSTIGKLACGLYQPTEGGVLIDGTDTRHSDIAELRNSVQYVGQDTELFTGSLRENVMLANPQNSDALESCLNGAGVSAFASRHPLGLEMQVGERGKSLSGGQKQSVGIARAMLADPKVMFLDEPTGQMDTMTEAAFIRSFGNWLETDATLIIATHRNTLLELVDRLIVIDEGKILIDGPKDRVLKSLSQGQKKPGRKRGGARATS